MLGKYNKFIRILYLGGDILLLNISFFLGHFIVVNDFIDINEQYLFLIVLANLLWLLLANYSNNFTMRRLLRYDLTLISIIKMYALHSLMIVTFTFAMKDAVYTRSQLFWTLIIFLGLIVFWRSLMFVLIKRYRWSGFNFRNAVIIGTGTIGQRLYKHITTDHSLGFRVLAFFDNVAPLKPGENEHVHFGGINTFAEFLDNNDVDEVFFALPLTRTKEIQQVLSLAENKGIRFKLVPDFRGISNRMVNIQFYDNLPIVTIREEPLENVFNRLLKRGFDVAFSLGVILLLFPFIFPVIIAMIKLSSPGPIFFKQLRTGRGNSRFYCYKFRTMKVNTDSDKKQATANDTRVTKIGRILRKTNLDELPQFFNVLFGQMSIVGPRPHMIKHNEDYAKIIGPYNVRHFVKPGITGWAQVNGFRGVTDTRKKIRKRVQYDVWYIENWSFILDIQIIFMTVFNMAKGDKNAV